MIDYRLSDLLDLAIIQKMAEAHYRATGIPIGIIDTIDGSILVGSGWQDICVKFHRADPGSLQHCRESDDYIKERLARGEACHYKCKNGLWDIGIPIVVAGRHLATMFLGQFFYEGEAPDRDFFTRSADQFGFDVDDYLAALDRVPVFSHEKVDYILEYDKALVGFIADLAEHALLKIKAEEETRRQTEFLQILIDAMPYAIFYKDRHGRYLGCNRAFEQSYGISRERITGKTVHEIAPKELADVYQRTDDELFAHPGKQTYEGSIQSTDGVRHDVIFHKATFAGPDGALAGLVGAVVDITARKQAERALAESEAKTRSILDNIGIGVALISPEMEVLEMNQRMREWFPAIDPGRRPLCYRAFNDPPREATCDYCPTRKTLQDGQTHEATTQTPQAGGIRNYRIVSSPILNPAGEVTAAIEMVEDITEKLSLESQLRQAQKMESVGRLAGGVAHDFNNMLGVIIGHTELALDRMDPAQPLSSCLREIRKAADRSADLTRQLLAFARKQTVAPKVVELNETVEGMLNMLRRLIGEDIDIVWLPDSDLWPVKMDPTQIDQILANLCLNARDAIAGVGKVTIETHTVIFDEDYCAVHSGTVPGDFVMLAVSDDGHGMDKGTLDKIFEPFFTTKEVGKGTGLGLAMVYGIVKQNDGLIYVYSEPGHGSTFKIYLPRHTAQPEPRQKIIPAVPDPHGHETILLVEDEAAILKITKLLLERLGYRVLSASTPDKALGLAGEHDGEINLLITDVIMPGMNGRDLANKLVSFNPELRSLFMSGYTSDVIAHHGVLDDGIHFMQKPFSKHALAAKVREALDSK